MISEILTQEDNKDKLIVIIYPWWENMAIKVC